MKKVFAAIAILTVLTILSANSVMAQYGQYGYGGAPTTAQQILVDKMVGKPNGQTKGGLPDYQYVDNLQTSDPRFKANQEVAFRIKVKNPTTIKLVNVQAKDYLPANVVALEGPGDYDAAKNVVSFNVGDLNPGEEKVYYVKAQIASEDKLPADKGLYCLTNKAHAYTDQASGIDTAQFCIEKQVTGAPQVPAAGPEFGLILLAGQFAGLGVGVFIRRKVS